VKNSVDLLIVNVIN